MCNIHCAIFTFTPTHTLSVTPTTPAPAFTGATFVYDGDGRRVAQTVNGVTTYFVGGHYEVTGSQVTKYYFAGTTRIAMRKYTIPQSMAVEYLLGDHLGSTSITTNNTGAKVSEMRYKPWGEVRYSWTSGQSATPAYELTDYTYTGQYSYTSDFGLMFYNARWYDPALGRFSQADTIVPGGVQGLDRYAYVNNAPMRYTDPSGHSADCGIDGIFCDNDPSNDHEYDFFYKPLLTFETNGDEKFTHKEKDVLLAGAQAVAQALADERNSACNIVAGMEGTVCNDLISPADAFFDVFGGSITVRRVDSGDCDCWAQHMGKINGHYEIWIYNTTSEQEILTHPNLIIHEIGHAFYVAAGGFIEGSSVGDRNGFYGFRFSWQFGLNDSETEIFADMFLGWVYGKWQVDQSRASGLSPNGEIKSAYMDKYMPLMINKAIGR